MEKEEKSLRNGTPLNMTVKILDIIVGGQTEFSDGLGGMEGRTQRE